MSLDGEASTAAAEATSAVAASTGAEATATVDHGAAASTVTQPAQSSTHADQGDTNATMQNAEAVQAPLKRPHVTLSAGMTKEEILAPFIFPPADQAGPGAPQDGAPQAFFAGGDGEGGESPFASVPYVAPQSSLLSISPQPSSSSAPSELIAILLPYLARTAFIELASFRLYALRQEVCGNARVRYLAGPLGLAPENMGERIASTASVTEMLRGEVADSLRDIALGCATELLVAQIKLTRTTEELRDRLLALFSHLSEREDPKLLDLTVNTISYKNVKDWIRTERQYGDFQNDPAWEDGTKKKHMWESRLNESIGTWNDRFHAAVGAVDWSEVAKLDSNLIQTRPMHDAGSSCLPTVFQPAELEALFDHVTGATDPASRHLANGQTFAQAFQQAMVSDWPTPGYEAEFEAVDAAISGGGASTGQATKRLQTRRYGPVSLMPDPCGRRWDPEAEAAAAALPPTYDTYWLDPEDLVQAAEVASFIPRCLSYHAAGTNYEVPIDFRAHPLSSNMSEDQLAALGKSLRRQFVGPAKLAADADFKAGAIAASEEHYFTISRAQLPASMLDVPEATEDPDMISVETPPPPLPEQQAQLFAALCAQFLRMISESPQHESPVEPSALLNYAATLLKSAKFKEAEHACTLALALIEARALADHALRKKSRASKQPTRAPSEIGDADEKDAAGVGHADGLAQQKAFATARDATRSSARLAAIRLGIVHSASDSTLLSPAQSVQLARQNSTHAAGSPADVSSNGASASQAPALSPMLADLRWKALIRRGRSRRALLELQFEHDIKATRAAQDAQEQQASLPPQPAAAASTTAKDAVAALPEAAQSAPSTQNPESSDPEVLRSTTSAQDQSAAMTAKPTATLPAATGASHERPAEPEPMPTNGHGLKAAALDNPADLAPDRDVKVMGNGKSESDERKPEKPDGNEINGGETRDGKPAPTRGSNRGERRPYRRPQDRRDRDRHRPPKKQPEPTAASAHGVTAESAPQATAAPSATSASAPKTVPTASSVAANAEPSKRAIKRGKAAALIKKLPITPNQRQKRREAMLGLAREDFNAAVHIDANETARFEFESLLSIDTKL